MISFPAAQSETSTHIYDVTQMICHQIEEERIHTKKTDHLFTSKIDNNENIDIDEMVE